jgi:hypothetical protein
MGISRFPHELLIEPPTLNTFSWMIREIITGNETAGNGLFAIARNSPTHHQHTPGSRRKSLSVKLANMSGFLAVADGIWDPKVAEWVKMLGL